MQPLSPARYANRYEDPATGWFTVTLDADLVLFVTIDGKGTMKGTKAMIGMFNEIAALREEGEQVDAFFDLVGLTKTPLRAQAILAKWLIGHRDLVNRIALVGARAWERKIAQAVLKLARFDRAAFFKSHDEAARWLRPQRGT